MDLPGGTQRPTSAWRVRRCLELAALLESATDDAAALTAALGGALERVELELRSAGRLELGRLVSLLRQVTALGEDPRRAAFLVAWGLAGLQLVTTESGEVAREQAAWVMAGVRRRCPSLTPDGDAAVAARPAKRIAFLDDSALTREMVKLALEEQGHEVVVAEQLADLEEMLRAFRPQLIMLDVDLPGALQGDEICAALKRKPEAQGIPIILFSGLGEEELAHLARRAHADGFVSKQHGFDRLIELLRNVIDEIVW